jgi:hypothetical protein
VDWYICEPRIASIPLLTFQLVSFCHFSFTQLNMASLENLAIVTATPISKAQEFKRDLTLSAVWTPVIEGTVTNCKLIL